MCRFTKFVPFLEILLNILEMYDKMQTSKEATKVSRTRSKQATSRVQVKEITTTQLLVL